MDRLWICYLLNMVIAIARLVYRRLKKQSKNTTDWNLGLENVGHKDANSLGRLTKNGLDYVMEYIYKFNKYWYWNHGFDKNWSPVNTKHHGFYQWWRSFFDGRIGRGSRRKWVFHTCGFQRKLADLSYTNWEFDQWQLIGVQRWGVFHFVAIDGEDHEEPCLD